MFKRRTYSTLWTTAVRIHSRWHIFATFTLLSVEKVNQFLKKNQCQFPSLWACLWLTLYGTSAMEIMILFSWLHYHNFLTIRKCSWSLLWNEVWDLSLAQISENYPQLFTHFFWPKNPPPFSANGAKWCSETDERNTITKPINFTILKLPLLWMPSIHFDFIYIFNTLKTKFCIFQYFYQLFLLQNVPVNNKVYVGYVIYLFVQSCGEIWWCVMAHI